jgi:hypothetical protein
MRVSNEHKSNGRKPYFTEELEDQIGAEYALPTSTARELSIKYAPLASGGKLSESAVRAIYRRYVRRQVGKAA